MTKIEKLKINTTNTEVEFVDPSENNPLKRYNADLPQEYKKVDFLEMPPEWQHRQIEAYCDFMTEVIPNSLHLATKANTMAATTLAKIDFPNYNLETQFSPTHFNISHHQVKIDIKFKFDYLEDNDKYTDVEVHESEGEDHSLEAGEKISDVWKSSKGTLELAHNIIETFPQLEEKDMLMLTSSILIQVQNSINMNSAQTTLECSGFTNDSLDKMSELAQKMAVAKMKMSIDISSPKYTHTSKNKIH